MLRLKQIYMLLIILIVVFGGLNLYRYVENNRVVTTWSSRESEYYLDQEPGPITKLTGFLHPSNLIYQITRIRPRVPLTYLRREIPLLGMYTPDDLAQPTATLYREDTAGSPRVIRLKYDLSRDSTPPPSSNPISQDKTTDRPFVALYHTHTSETYIDDPRPQDNNGHVAPGQIGYVARVGQVLAQTLRDKYNFRVIHTTRVHDRSYLHAYYNSRNTVKSLVKNYPELDMILDLHRDGLKQQAKATYTAVLNNQQTARVMVVVTDGSFDFSHLDLSDHHPQWERNLNFARLFTGKMEEMYPGLLTRMEVRQTTYNQDLHPRALLLEIGDYQNTTREAVRSARLLADVIASILDN